PRDYSGTRMQYAAVLEEEEEEEEEHAKSSKILKEPNEGYLKKVVEIYYLNFFEELEYVQALARPLGVLLDARRM
ncbi:hypothetical protein ACJX0J_011544, partial [Zea mays]